MQEDLARLVHPILGHALDLKDSLARGEPANLDVEPGTLRNLLLTELEAKRWADFGGDGVAVADVRDGDALLGCR